MRTYRDAPNTTESPFGKLPQPRKSVEQRPVGESRGCNVGGTRVAVVDLRGEIQRIQEGAPHRTKPEPEPEQDQDESRRSQ